MKKRRTFSVTDFVRHANRVLADSHGVADAQYRKGVASMTEHLLLEAGRYEGYGYLTAAEVPWGELPGIEPDPDQPGTNRFPDCTRRKYYVFRQEGER